MNVAQQPPGLAKWMAVFVVRQLTNPDSTGSGSKSRTELNNTSVSYSISSGDNFIFAFLDYESGKFEYNHIAQLA